PWAVTASFGFTTKVVATAGDVELSGGRYLTQLLPPVPLFWPRWLAICAWTPPTVIVAAETADGDGAITATPAITVDNAAMANIAFAEPHRDWRTSALQLRDRP